MMGIDPLSDCPHPDRSIVDGMSAHADAPYDAGDFWWIEECDTCGATLAEGDGYDHPHRRR
jgi:hypothetical protein